jgi:hypothetical protein
MVFISTNDKQQALNIIVEQARALGLEDDLDKIGIAINRNEFSEYLNPTVDVIKPWQKIEPCPGAVGLPLKTLLNDKSMEKARKDGASLWIRNNKYLVLQVDLSRKKADIMREFETMIKLAIKHVPKPKNRKRDRELDHWEIYKLHKKEGLKFVEIARNKWPERAKKQGKNSLSLKNECMHVQRAYNKAKTIIEQIRKYLGLNTKKGKKDYHKNHI